MTNAVTGTRWVYLTSHAVIFFVGVSLTLLGGPIAVAIGTSLIAAGAAGYLIFGYVTLIDRTRERLEVLERFGVERVFEARAARIRSEYDSRLQAAQDNIDILGFGLRALREDYGKDFAAWKRRARVRILVLDTTTAVGKRVARQRDQEESNAAGSIAGDVDAFMAAVQNVLELGRFEVRKYSCLPSVNIFRVDDQLFWGPYLVGDQSRNLPTVIVRSPGILYGRLTRHFEEIWENWSEPIAPAQ